MKDRLIELMKEWGTKNTDSFPFESVADYILANGVIVPPCKCGDTVYVIDNTFGIMNCFVDHMEILDDNELKIVCESKLRNITKAVSPDDFGKTVFFTKEEAEQALKGGDV